MEVCNGPWLSGGVVRETWCHMFLVDNDGCLPDKARIVVYAVYR
jgi:hypothetical protein